MHSTKWQSANKGDLIIEVWEALDCESVGERELAAIQNELSARFGDGAVDSPAAIARALADEGAVLRHPEVFDFDLNWREKKLAQNSFKGELLFSNFFEALKSFEKLETARVESEKRNDAVYLEHMRSIVAGLRESVLETAHSIIFKQEQREMAQEIAEWMTVWLRTPQLFPDWLALRQNSPEFERRFRS